MGIETNDQGKIDKGSEKNGRSCDSCESLEGWVGRVMRESEGWKERVEKGGIEGVKILGERVGEDIEGREEDKEEKGQGGERKDDSSEGRAKSQSDGDVLLEEVDSEQVQIIADFMKDITPKSDLPLQKKHHKNTSSITAPSDEVLQAQGKTFNSFLEDELEKIKQLFLQDKPFLNSQVKKAVQNKKMNENGDKNGHSNITTDKKEEISECQEDNKKDSSRKNHNEDSENKPISSNSSSKQTEEESESESVNEQEQKGKEESVKSPSKEKSENSETSESSGKSQSPKAKSEKSVSDRNSPQPIISSPEALPETESSQNSSSSQENENEVNSKKQESLKKNSHQEESKSSSEDGSQEDSLQENKKSNNSEVSRDSEEQSSTIKDSDIEISDNSPPHNNNKKPLSERSLPETPSKSKSKPLCPVNNPEEEEALDKPSLTPSQREAHSQLSHPLQPPISKHSSSTSSPLTLRQLSSSTHPSLSKQVPPSRTQLKASNRQGEINMDSFPPLFTQ